MAVQQIETISVGDCFQRGFAQIKVVGFKGKTTVMVSTYPHPISSRLLPAKGIRIRTLLRDWTLVQ